jgi:hypothetical protein
MLDVASPIPAAQGLPLSSAVHHCQSGSVCTADFVSAPAGTPGGPEGVAGDDEELSDDDDDEEDDWLLDPEDWDDPPDVCAGSAGTICDPGVDSDEEGFAPQPISGSRNKKMKAGNNKWT